MFIRSDFYFSDSLIRLQLRTASDLNIFLKFIAKMGDQGQHLISEVYLKQFSFVEKGKKVISVWEKSNDWTSNKSIKSFLKKTNYFDLNSISTIDSRTFEDINNRLETLFPKILQDVNLRGGLGRNNKIVIKQFVANLICRTPHMRTKIDALYNDPSTREKFLGEISMFCDTDKKKAIKIVDSIAAEDRLNYLAIFVMLHISVVFKNFEFCIIKSFEERGWITSDNPVVLDYNGFHNWLIPEETEVYFPISKNYCLFMYNPNSSNQTNILRKHSGGTFVSSNEEIQERIFEKIFESSFEYIIFPWNLGRVKLSSI